MDGDSNLHNETNLNQKHVFTKGKHTVLTCMSFNSDDKPQGSQTVTITSDNTPLYQPIL